jgi:predicted nucleic-acid-binding protein
MIALDTNVWVRYVTNDDPFQARRAMDILAAADKVFLPKTVLLELEWVLRAAYHLPRHAILKSMLQILGLPMVRVENPEQVAQALDWFRRGIDFADALHLAGCDEAEAFVTFDEVLIRKGKRLKLPVKHKA